MAAPSGKQYAYGMKHARAYALNSSALPAATTTTVYEGARMYGARAYELNIPDTRRIISYGDMKINAVAFLPPTEAPSGVLRVGRHDFDVHAILSGTKVATIGELKAIGYSTDQQGSEPDVFVHLWQPSKDADTKVTRYRNLLMPVTNAIIRPPGMLDDFVEFMYDLLVQPIKKYPWGVAFAEGTEGYTEAGILEIMTENPLMIAAWLGDNVATEFLFHADRPAISVDKIHIVTANGVADATVTKALTKITPSTKPASGVMVVCAYEYAA